MGRKDKKKKQKKDRAGRGVETLFRNAYRTHVELSNLADTKANIIISINGLIISVLVATTASPIQANPRLLAPTFVLLLSSSIALVLAILAARPRVTQENIDPEDVRSGRRNILFFGTFTNMPEDDFLDSIDELIEGDRDPYRAMAHDLYSLGGVLTRKYRLLRTAYTVFMYGLVIAGILLIVVLANTATAGPTSPVL